MNVRWALSLPMWTFIAVLVLTVRVEAQAPMGALGPAAPAFSPEQPGMGGPAFYAGGPMPDSAMPYASDAGGPPMNGGPYGGDPSAMYGGGGFEDGGQLMPGDCGPGGYRGLLGDFLGLIGPYADGGCNAPRYFDVSVEAMWLKREDAGRNVDLTSQGIGGPIVLSTDQFSFNERPSFRFTAWLQFRSRGNLEFNYFGLFHHNDSVQVTDPTNQLFSALSQFGTVPMGGFLEEGNANYNRMEFSSQFDNFEGNFRRHWQGPNGRLQGSILYGARYFKLDEDFDFITVSTVNGGQSRYHVNTNNSLTGAQTGGDVWVCIIPGLRAGVDGKVGVFGNHSSQGTRISATSLAVPYTESSKSDDVALVSDVAFYLTYRINYQLNVKLGYNFLYVDGLTLATEQFNSTPPNQFLNGAGRVVTQNDNGHVLYHGASIGVEYNW